MRARSKRTEILDRPDASERHLVQSLKFMMRVNRYFGGTRAVLGYFERENLPDSFTVADLGSGSGDIPYALARWAEVRHKKVRVVAFETHPLCLSFARKHHAHPSVIYQAAPASDFEAHGPFDYVISSMFFHHLSDEEIVFSLKRLERAGRRGFVVNDLYRSALAFGAAAAYAGLTLDAGVIHDATVSVLRSFRHEDWERYRHESGVSGLKWRRVPWFRWVVSHSKP